MPGHANQLNRQAADSRTLSLNNQPWPHSNDVNNRSWLIHRAFLRIEQSASQQTGWELLENPELWYVFHFHHGESPIGRGEI